MPEQHYCHYMNRPESGSRVLPNVDGCPIEVVITEVIKWG
jgi:hypothetical protein